MKPVHNKTGNCWERAYHCPRCPNELCDVCHKHDEPRGDCSECPRCPACDANAASYDEAAKR